MRTKIHKSINAEGRPSTTLRAGGNAASQALSQGAAGKIKNWGETAFPLKTADLTREGHGGKRKQGGMSGSFKGVNFHHGDTDKILEKGVKRSSFRAETRNPDLRNKQSVLTLSLRSGSTFRVPGI